MNVRDIQQALADAGYDPGPIDGIRGRKTIEAIKAFQEANGLTPDGIVGPLTIAKLFPGQAQHSSEEDFSVPSHMPWLHGAFNLIGTREKPGAGSNEAIIGWAKDLNLLSYTDDDIPWCGLFVAHCIGSQLPQEPLPNNPLGARQWEKFGHVEATPCLGAVMVFWRESKQSGKGHVGFYWAEDNDAYHILGGNQSNSVSVARLSKERFIAARWPNTADNPTPVRRMASVNGQLLSQNEA